MLRRTGLILLFLANILTVTGNNSRAEAAKILTIGNYTLLSSTRVSLYEFDYVYKASITNTGPAVTGVTASAASTSAYIKILQGNLTFGNVPANATVTSSDTFTVRHDRRGAFDTTKLVWSIKVAPSQVTVPNVVGMTRSNAQAAILAAKLKVGTVTEEASSEIPAGNIISQTPVAGTSVAAGSAVNLVVSAGSTSVTVPNLVGQTQASAQAAIIAAKLVVGAITQAPSKTVPAGSVISQNPGAGATATQGSAVDLVVSSGKPALAVPDVTGLILAAAKAAITRAGLNVGTVTRQNSAAVISGNVISQEPAAGTSTSAGATVKLVVSSGPA
ncbi:MAG TPA: PASTA domain-containing protein, partial [Geobacteraceae bacterium]|nr:PASTA domain-containing protein [Geobacteraceae bacterium]